MNKSSTDLQKHHGRNIQMARKIAGLTQEQLAERVGVTQQTVSDWEAGSQGIRDHHKIAVAQATGQDPQQLFPLVLGHMAQFSGRAS